MEKRCESKMSEIKIVRTTTPKEKPQDETKLVFGAVTTDHMVIMNYTEGKGWHDPRMVQRWIRDSFRADASG